LRKDKRDKRDKRESSDRRFGSTKTKGKLKNIQIKTNFKNFVIRPDQSSKITEK